MRSRETPGGRAPGAVGQARSSCGTEARLARPVHTKIPSPLTWRTHSRDRRRERSVNRATELSSPRAESDLFRYFLAGVAHTGAFEANLKRCFHFPGRSDRPRV